MPKLDLTENEVNKLKYGEGRRVFYYDTNLSGFGVYVTKDNKKTFFVHGDVKGKSVKHVIGKHGVYTVKQARKLGTDALQKMRSGINPNDEKKQLITQALTLECALTKYLEARPFLAEKTVTFYENCVDFYLADWKPKPMIEISEEMVIIRSAKLQNEKSVSVAHAAMRTLRTIFNHFKGLKGYSITSNPVLVLREKELWPELKKRKGSILPNIFTRWFQAVLDEENPDMRDFIFFLLFTGVRRTAGLKQEWQHVDLEDRIITLYDDKEDEYYTVPLSSYLYNVLKKRRDEDPEGLYVFPGTGKTGHLAEPRRGVDRVSSAAGFKFIPHDLRRTFNSVASFVGVPDYVRKKLVNHSTNGDITDDYNVWNVVEALREHVEKITSTILKFAGVSMDSSHAPDDTSGATLPIAIGHDLVAKGQGGKILQLSQYRHGTK